MNRDYLTRTAEQLQQPSLTTANEFAEKADNLAAIMNDRFRQRNDLHMMIGETNLDMMQDNHRNHMRFLVSVFKNYEPEVLVETVLWVFRAYRSHGFNLSYWPAQLDSWVEIHRMQLSPQTFTEIYPFYHWMIIHIPVFVKLTDEMLSTSEVYQNKELRNLH